MARVPPLVLLLVAGAVLGVASRVEEVVDGFSVGISSDAAWVLVAFAAGALARSARAGAAAGVLVLTVANAAYYAWIVATEPGIDPAAVAGSPVRWLALGVGAGLVFGLAGRV